MSTDLASAWDAPRMAGRPYVLVQPESKANVYLRFMAADWPFAIAGVPRPLGPNSATVAMQVIGPAKETVSIEIDGYPATATARPTRKGGGELPPAIAIVGFEIDSLDHLKVPSLAPPRVVAGEPYSGRRVAVARGAAGELIELIESP